MKTSYIKKVCLNCDKIKNYNEYPFNIPCIEHFSDLKISDKVTFFIGENGTGKSTLLEAIAVNFGFNAEGGSQNFTFSTYASHSALSEYLLLAKGLAPKDGYFLRAESFYNVASNIEQLDASPSFDPMIKESYGGKSLHECSHGESFFALLKNRLFGNGLYIFDEPEAALSPMRQIEMLKLIHKLICNHSQIIIATHSPILMAYPDSLIYGFSQNGIHKTNYEDTEHYKITKDFLNDYAFILSQIINE